MAEKLKVAAKLGADNTFLATKELSEEKTVQHIHGLFGGPPDITIEASGALPSIRLAILVSLRSLCQCPLMIKFFENFFRC